MKVENLKELEKLVKLCRRTGVQAIKIDGIEFALGADPQASIVKSAIDETVFPEANIRVPKPNIAQVTDQVDKVDMPDELTQEQLMFYSARPEELT